MATEEIMVNRGGINWCWYSKYEFTRTEEDPTRAIGKITWSDRFHKWNESQGASTHPEAEWNHDCSSNKPILRVYAREMTEEEKAREQDSFDFFWKGWARWCKQYKLDPEQYQAIHVVHHRTTKERLTILVLPEVAK